MTINFPEDWQRVFEAQGVEEVQPPDLPAHRVRTLMCNTQRYGWVLITLENSLWRLDGTWVCRPYRIRTTDGIVYNAIKPKQRRGIV